MDLAPIHWEAFSFRLHIEKPSVSVHTLRTIQLPATHLEPFSCRLHIENHSVAGHTLRTLQLPPTHWEPFSCRLHIENPSVAAYTLRTFQLGSVHSLVDAAFVSTKGDLRNCGSEYFCYFSCITCGIKYYRIRSSEKCTSIKQKKYRIRKYS